MSKNNSSNTQLLWLFFGAGTLAGIFGGKLLLEQNKKQHFKHILHSWQSELERTREPFEAARLINSVRARYGVLMTKRRTFSTQALNKHLEANILPGLALYQILLEDGLEQDKALQQVEHLWKVALIKQRRLYEKIGRYPWFYSLLRFLTPLAMKTTFPAQGWDVRWIQNDDEIIAFDMERCFYFNVLSAYQTPELTVVYCNLDHYLYDDLSAVMHFERSGTLAMGCEACDFRFYRRR